MPLESTIPPDPREPRIVFAGYLVLSVGLVFAGMTAFMTWGLIKSYRDNATWDGVSCCDPLEDIGVLWVITIFVGLISLGSLAIARILFTPTSATRR